MESIGLAFTLFTYLTSMLDTTYGFDVADDNFEISIENCIIIAYFCLMWRLCFSLSCAL